MRTCLTRLRVFILVFSIYGPGWPSIAQEASSDAVLEFENAWVRVVRVRYTAHQKTSMHDHPATPTVYVYTTDGGRLEISHEGEKPIIRPPVKAGAIRFQRGVAERHVVQELDGVNSEYVRVELKTEPVDLPEQDVRRAPGDFSPYESGMIRIQRVSCPAHASCPPPDHPERPSILVENGKVRWIEAGSAPIANPLEQPIELVRIELKSNPSSSSH